MKSRIFPLLLFTVSVFIAGTAAFFSVKGIGLLFAGSFIPVVIMASSLELGKLFAVSFLYRKWNELPRLFRAYLTLAVVVLIGITSLGIFGFLSAAYQDTKNKVSHIEAKILSIENQNQTIRKQIEQSQSKQSDKVTQNNNVTDRYKSIYDEFVSQQNVLKQQLIDRLNTLDEQMQAAKDKPGGLFSNKKKDIEQLELKQQPDRQSISEQLEQVDQSIKAEYEKFMNKVDSLSNDEVIEKIDTSVLYDQLEENSNHILSLQDQANKTDIGSFKFIASAFDITVDDAVKWFTIVIVIVFDPLAMILMIGYNMYVHPKNVNAYRKYAPPSVIPTTFKK